MSNSTFPPSSQGESPSMDILRRLIQEELEKQLESESLAFSQHRVLDALEAWAVVRSLLIQDLCSLAW